jgi:hypothetical protein
MIAPGETVRAVNQESFPITIGWGNIQYILQPGVDTFVPADAVINYFGDPRANLNMQSLELPNGQKAWVLDRATEVRRLRVKWQAYNMDNGELELVAPKVDVFTILGEWVPTVTADPDGKHVNPAALTAQSELDRDQLITKMQQQLDILLRERNMGEILEPATSESDVPVDDPNPFTEEPSHARPRAANDN